MADAQTCPPGLREPHEALAELLAALSPVAPQTVPLAEAVGCVLAEPALADRDNPPADVSAMDGYAVRCSDLSDGVTLPVAGEVLMGQDPGTLPAGACMQVFTGGCIPSGADAVIKREDTAESPEAMTLEVAAGEVTEGLNIRFQGENAPAGTEVVAAGTVVQPQTVAALASFGAAEVSVRRGLRVAILTTGDELYDVAATPPKWAIRDSNGPTLEAYLSASPIVSEAKRIRVEDTREGVIAAFTAALETSDVLLVTGGVSMGDHDYVPSALEAVGAKTVYHKLMMRPGKPNLGAVGPAGQAILGLPGNPVSVMTGARVFGAAVLRRLAGADPTPAQPKVAVQDAKGKTLHLWWYRPVRLNTDGVAEVLATMGSGDLASVASSDGFVVVPPHEKADAEPRTFYRWTFG